MTASGIPNDIRHCDRDPVLVSRQKNIYSMSKLAIGNPVFGAPRIPIPVVKEEVQNGIPNVERDNYVYFESSMGSNHFATNNLIHINHNTLTTRGKLTPKWREAGRI